MEINRHPDSQPMTDDSYRAVSIMSAQGFEPTPGVAYCVFSCGCIRTDSIKRFAKNTTFRACPEHRDHRLLGKFKRCHCGVDWIGRQGIRSSKSCVACANTSYLDYKRASEGQEFLGGASIAHKPPEHKTTEPVKIHPGRPFGVRYERKENIDWDILLAVQGMANRRVVEARY